MAQIGLNAIPDRHYSDMCDKDLITAHELLYKAVLNHSNNSRCRGRCKQQLQIELNELLEMARELTFREVI